MQLIIRTVAVVLFLVTATNAQAGLVPFSFDNLIGNVSGTVNGTLSGLADNGTSSATNIFIDSAPAGLGFATFPFDVLSLGWVEVKNSVTISNGVVTDVEILIAGTGGSFGNNFMLNYGIVNRLNDIQGQRGVTDISGFAGVTFGPLTGAVPVPSTLTLFGLCLAGVGWSRRKKS